VEGPRDAHGLDQDPPALPQVHPFHGGMEGTTIYPATDGEEMVLGLHQGDSSSGDRGLGQWSPSVNFDSIQYKTFSFDPSKGESEKYLLRKVL